uniref:Reverse transcriptase domain-containing protein n=1 Tax=Aegilops tauschii subsp. strangulata TaxID=200361 RepID=A0A453LYD3_AEGTS
MQLVSGGHIAVSVNGRSSNFFQNFRGLRQGDPASPILFNFVADALSNILSRAAAAGHISPVSSYLIPEGVSRLKYADDTIIMVELNDPCLSHLKFLRLCFEALSGLKINFSKSEVIITGVTEAEALRVSQLLNCLLGSFPLRYLGLSISSDKLLAKDYAPTVAKVGNLVMPWWGRYNTQAGKVA